MAGGTPINIVGTMGGDPELRDAGGTQVAGFSVAVTSRTKDGDQWVDGATTWFRVSAWRDLGVNVAQSFHKGDRVIVQGTLEERPWTDRDGNQRSSMEVTAEEIGASVRYATVTAQKVVRNGNQGQRRDQRSQQRGGQPQRQVQQPRQQAQQDPWAQPGQYDESEVF